MTFLGILHRTLLGLALVALAGCSALSSIQTASRPVDTYELTPLPAGSVRAAGSGRHLEVALPTATGALASDRIVVKPTPFRVESLPDGRWINDTTEHLQLLLVRSLANSNRFALVTGAGSGPSPDLVLLTDLQAFQAEITETGAANIVISARMTLLRDTDGRILGSRSFSSAVPVPDTSAAQIVVGFDAAATEFLEDVVGWIAAIPAG